MIISKAIEILSTTEIKMMTASDHDYFDALKLGTEALKRLESIRKHPGAPVYGPLPGETMPDRGVQAGLESRQAKKPK